MMLVQKQPHFNISPPHIPLSHRRHPSAPPAVLVQSTRTPGLLSLSKPVQRVHQPQQRAKQSPKVKQAAAARRSPQLGHALPVPKHQEQLKPSPEITDKKTSSPQSTPEKRGRQSVKDRDSRPARSTSNTSVRGRRNNTRQPSPPLLAPSQAEIPSTPPRKAAVDPDQADDVSFPVPTAPTLSSHPSGKLARRRQPQHAKSFVTPPRAIPVQHRPASLPSLHLSRSMPAQPFKGKAAPDTSQWKPFPICDDLTEADLFTDATCPSTPSPRPRPKAFDDGPRTAPLTTGMASFPFNLNMPESPSPSMRKAWNHIRTPSEGVFFMSSDESSSDELSTVSRRKTISFSKFGKMTEAELEAAVAAGYFASSTFQNSPSPEDLPPPMFL